MSFMIHPLPKVRASRWVRGRRVHCGIRMGSARCAMAGLRLANRPAPESFRWACFRSSRSTRATRCRTLAVRRCDGRTFRVARSCTTQTARIHMRRPCRNVQQPIQPRSINLHHLAIAYVLQTPVADLNHSAQVDNCPNFARITETKPSSPFSPSILYCVFAHLFQPVGIYRVTTEPRHRDSPDQRQEN